MTTWLQVILTQLLSSPGWSTEESIFPVNDQDRKNQQYYNHLQCLFEVALWDELTSIKVDRQCTGLKILISVIHRLDELNCRHKLHPPVLLLTRQPLLVETADILNVRHKWSDARLDQHHYQYGYEVIGGRHWTLICHAQQVHYCRRATQHTLQLVFWCL